MGSEMRRCNRLERCCAGERQDGVARRVHHPYPVRAFFILPTLGLLVVGTIGCTSFVAVRSAEVPPGASGAFQVSLASPPGDDAGWFWSFDCESECDHVIPSYDVGFLYGLRWASPFEFGLGINGTYPYLQGFFQLGGLEGGDPWGIGGRLGIPFGTWHEHRLFGRYDVRLDEQTRILLNPALYYFAGNSPNGKNPGSFVGFVQGIGLELRGERVSFIPAASLIVGRTERESYGEKAASSTTVFGAASISFILRRRHRPSPG